MRVDGYLVWLLVRSNIKREEIVIAGRVVRI